MFTIDKTSGYPVGNLLSFSHTGDFVRVYGLILYENKLYCSFMTALAYIYIYDIDKEITYSFKATTVNLFINSISIHEDRIYISGNERNKATNLAYFSYSPIHAIEQNHLFSKDSETLEKNGKFTFRLLIFRYF